MKTILIFTLFSSLAWGQVNSERVFFFGETMMVFTKVNGTMVNKNCGDSCDALVKAKDASKISVPSDLLVGGKNPAAARCKLLEGTVIIGVDKEGNEQSFCRFADGSYLNNSSIL